MHDRLELIHLSFSHYNEKARWALDFKRVPHTRRTFDVLGPHRDVVRPLTGSTQLPVVTAGGRVIAGSAAIIDFLEERHPAPPLYPADPEQRARALELQRHFDEHVGPAIRLLFVVAILRDRDYAARHFLGEIARAINVSADREAAARELTDAAFARVAANATPYLVGDAFSVADLAAAALLSIALYPPEFPYVVPAREAEPMRAWFAQHEDRPGAAWVREMYRRHRAPAD